MTGSAIGSLIAFAVLLALSSFFSASETSFSSLNRIRMKNLAAEGNQKAAAALALEAQYDKLLSTILIGNNVVNIASSALATVLFVGWFGNVGVTLSTIVTTILVLLFGEISPKTLAKESPEKFAMFATPFLRVLMVVLTPVNAAFSAWKRLLVKVFRIGEKAGASEEELLTFVQEVRQDGVIDADEENLIRSVIEFDDLTAEDIATPRVDVRAVAVGDDNEAIQAAFMETGFSRLPVYGESLDDIRGVLLEKDFHYYVQTGEKPIENVIRPALFVTTSIKIDELLGQLQKGKMHLAVVVDEYGGAVGIVTIEDILEELVGEIWDEHDQVKLDITELAGGRWRVLGSASVDKLFAQFGINEEADSISAGGWASEALGRIPAEHDRFTACGLQVEVEKVNRHRVESLLVRPVEVEDKTTGDAVSNTDRPKPGASPKKPVGPEE